MTKLLEEVNLVLSGFPDYIENGILHKSKVIDDLREYKKDLIEGLLANDLIKNAYSLKVENGLIFKINEFIDMLRYKNYWDNSYTKFSNEIGLTSDNRYLKYNTDVVLDFPHKDCVLEGGMTEEDVGKKEVYYHKVLAKDEIDIMLSPKLLTNIRKYDEYGEHVINEYDNKSNLVLKGNNLIALHSIRNNIRNKCKLLIIDPPYNTGGDSFKYNDRFNHSTWLTFMWNRLEIARDLLSDGGSIWVVIDDNEVHYLKVIMDSIFPNGFVANVLWQKRTSPDARATLGDAHDHILVYTNNIDKFKEQLKTLPLTDEQKDRFKNPDDDPRGLWASSDFTAQGFRPNQMYTIVTPSGKEYSPPAGRCWKNIESEYRKIREEGRMWFGKNGDAMPRRKTYLAESPGMAVWTWWTNKEVGHNQEAKKESIALFGENNPFSTPKPERLIHRIVSLCTDENDIVLDFFSGSGTTPSVCHKMNRRYIAIEQITYGIDYTPDRLKKVIEGEAGGISKEVGWKGGGNFVYAELFELNHQYVGRIQDAKSNEEIEELVAEIKIAAFLDYKVNINRLTNEDSEFATLSLENKKKLLFESLDSNQMYLSYSEIDDSQYDIPTLVKQFNHSFYQKNKTVNDHE